MTLLIDAHSTVTRKTRRIRISPANCDLTCESGES
jgi:hypothetical protein